MGKIHPSSFRDTAGFVFESEGNIYRQINQTYKSDYDILISSGLYEKLAKNQMLISHTDATDIPSIRPELAYKMIQVDRVWYISYPYEWCFSQYKDAALLTLKIQKEALEHGMMLKDASAYNVQFHNGRPIFIDTLSFVSYTEGMPWVAYRQFCQHFLAPLALMATKDIRLGRLMSHYIDGIPLDLASRVLPFSTKFRFGLLTHIHLHATAQARYSDSDSDKKRKKTDPKVSKLGLIGLIENLEGAINRLEWNPKGTDWASYYQDTNYSDASFENKKQIVQDLINETNANSVLDLGSNTGIFSRLVNKNLAYPVVSMDFDPGAVEINYREAKRIDDTHILPLVMDITNPSPDIGWNNRERSGFFGRESFDLLMALALVHHLAISNNLPLPMISATMATLCQHLIIEFVPKEDSQVKRLLAARDDIFPNYTLEGFRDAFSSDFQVIKEIPLPGTQRTLFLLERRNSNRG